MSPSPLSIERYETTAVYTHPDAEVDIVLVHGLNGHPEKTWTATNNTFWPRDLLPSALKGTQANVLVYGYNADVYSSMNDGSASDNFIHQHAQTLVANLTAFRKDEGTFKNPIIWVCHSLGGILVKRALLYSNDVKMTHHEDYRSIFVSTFGLIFLGTPHSGSDAASWGLMLQAMADAIMPRKLFQSESVLLKTLKRDNETLANINSHFLDIYQRFRIHMVHENHKTDIKGTKITIVDANSASTQLPGVTYYGVEASHSQMCKFASTSAPGFRAVSTAIREWVCMAPTVISKRWSVERQDKTCRKYHEMEEIQETEPPLMPPWSSAMKVSRPRRGSDVSQATTLVALTPLSDMPRTPVAGPKMKNFFGLLLEHGLATPEDMVTSIMEQLDANKRY